MCTAIAPTTPLPPYTSLPASVLVNQKCGRRAYSSAVPVLCVVQSDVQSICRRDQRHERTLLQLVVHDGRVRLACSIEEKVGFLFKET